MHEQPESKCSYPSYGENSSEHTQTGTITRAYSYPIARVEMFNSGVSGVTRVVFGHFLCWKNRFVGSFLKASIFFFLLVGAFFLVGEHFSSF